MEKEKLVELLNKMMEIADIAINYIDEIVGGDESETLEWLKQSFEEVESEMN